MYGHTATNDQEESGTSIMDTDDEDADDEDEDAKESKKSQGM